MSRSKLHFIKSRILHISPVADIAAPTALQKTRHLLCPMGRWKVPCEFRSAVPYTLWNWLLYRV